jgi:uncharacterized coiled-coil protein SlyX
MPRKIVNLQALRSLQEALERGDARSIISQMFHGERDEAEDEISGYGVPSEKLNLVIAHAPRSDFETLAKVVATTVARINELEAKALAQDAIHHGPNARATQFRKVVYKLRGFLASLGTAFDKSHQSPAPSPATESRPTRQTEETVAA